MSNCLWSRSSVPRGTIATSTCWKLLNCVDGLCTDGTASYRDPDSVGGNSVYYDVKENGSWNQDGGVGWNLGNWKDERSELELESEKRGTSSEIMKTDRRGSLIRPRRQRKWSC